MIFSEKKTAFYVLQKLASLCNLASTVVLVENLDFLPLNYLLFAVVIALVVKRMVVQQIELFIQNALSLSVFSR